MAEYLPLVTIVTPTYNRASLLDETIESILNQDYPRIEYIVLDDGSTDDTLGVLKKYQGRLIWESHPNMGEARTVNKGWSLAHGDIVGTVNSDDPLLPEAVSAVVAFLKEHPDIMVAYPDWNMIGPDSKVIRHIQAAEYDYLIMLREHGCLPGPGAFFRRGILELAGLRDPEFRYTGDYEFWLRAGLTGKFARIPKTLATWRLHPQAGTVSHAGAAMAAEHPLMIEKLYNRTDLPAEVRKVHAEALSKAYLAAAQACLSSKHYGLTARYQWRSIRLYPTVLFELKWWRWVFIHLLPNLLSNLLPPPLYGPARWCWRKIRRSRL